MSYNLFLDDVRRPQEPYYYTRDSKYIDLEWITAKNFNEFRKTIFEKGLPDMVSFDHDLSAEQYSIKMEFNSWEEYYNIEDREMTGYDCAKWLCEYCLEYNKKFPKYLVHSFNHIGAENIRNYIRNFLKHNKLPKN
jgi:hypothetical protein